MPATLGLPARRIGISNLLWVHGYEEEKTQYQDVGHRGLRWNDVFFPTSLAGNFFARRTNCFALAAALVAALIGKGYYCRVNYSTGPVS